VYILDQVRALENEMLLRMQKQGLDVDPKILIVSLFVYLLIDMSMFILSVHLATCFFGT
jgi:Sucrose synthase